MLELWHLPCRRSCAPAANPASTRRVLRSLESLRQMLISAQRSPTFLAGVLRNKYQGEQNLAYVSKCGKKRVTVLTLVSGKVVQRPLHRRVAFGGAASIPLQQHTAMRGR